MRAACGARGKAALRLLPVVLLVTWLAGGPLKRKRRAVAAARAWCSTVASAARFAGPVTARAVIYACRNSNKAARHSMTQVLNLLLGVGLPCFVSAAVAGQGGTMQVLRTPACACSFRPQPAQLDDGTLPLTVAVATSILVFVAILCM